MSTLPPDSSAPADPASRPARALMESPLATSVRVISRRRRMREQPRERGLRILGLVGALLVHIVFLLSFVLGDAYQVQLPPEPHLVALHIRLIDAPEPPPPPPVRGTPPREKGPRHKGHVSSSVAAAHPNRAQSGRRSSESSAAVVTRASRASAEPVTAQVTTVSAAAKPQPVAAPSAPVSVPRPAPAPQLQAVPLASQPPVVTLAKPTMTPPVPPRFQPEAVRPPQVEGNQPMPPPASLALPDVPAQAMQSVEKPTIALTLSAPKPSSIPSIAPLHAEVPATPPAPELQAVPLAAQPSPDVNLKMSVSVATPVVQRESIKVQAPAALPAEPQLDAVPLSPLVKPNVAIRSPTLKVDTADKASTSAVQTSISRPELSATPTAADAPKATTEAKAVDGTSASIAQSSTQSTSSEAPANADKSSADKSGAETSDVASSTSSQSSSDRDVSAAPDATAQGTDTATPGEANGVANAPQRAGREGSQLSTAQGQGSRPSAVAGGKGEGAGHDAGNSAGSAASGAPSGDKAGAIGSYVQVMPHGDTKIMDHSTPNIGYKSTRFNRDWTPLDESSVDTALRHAVEKTTVAHTFHLPRGVRIKCSISPLLPMALFGCGSGDPPPEPLADKVYDRMHLAPANPVVPPAPVSSAPITRAPVQLDNRADCATARVSGGPPPPGCVVMTLPVKLAQPASASSTGSWVPASDQFH